MQLDLSKCIKIDLKKRIFAQNNAKLGPEENLPSSNNAENI